jgi:hypothetical protein
MMPELNVVLVYWFYILADSGVKYLLHLCSQTCIPVMGTIDLDSGVDCARRFVPLSFR